MDTYKAMYTKVDKTLIIHKSMTIFARVATLFLEFVLNKKSTRTSIYSWPTLQGSWCIWDFGQMPWMLDSWLHQSAHYDK